MRRSLAAGGFDGLAATGPAARAPRERERARRLSRGAGSNQRRPKATPSEAGTSFRATSYPGCTTRTSYFPNVRLSTVNGVRPLHLPLIVTAALAGVEVTTSTPRGHRLDARSRRDRRLDPLTRRRRDRRRSLVRGSHRARRRRTLTAVSLAPAAPVPVVRACPSAGLDTVGTPATGGTVSRFARKLPAAKAQRKPQTEDKSPLEASPAAGDPAPLPRAQTVERQACWNRCSTKGAPLRAQPQASRRTTGPRRPDPFGPLQQRGLGHTRPRAIGLRIRGLPRAEFIDRHDAIRKIARRGKRSPASPSFSSFALRVTSASGSASSGASCVAGSSRAASHQLGGLRLGGLEFRGLDRHRRQDRRRFDAVRLEKHPGDGEPLGCG